MVNGQLSMVNRQSFYRHQKTLSTQPSHYQLSIIQLSIIQSSFKFTSFASVGTEPKEAAYAITGENADKGMWWMVNGQWSMVNGE